METLKKIVTNQYFPAAAVLTAVILFWAVGLLGGLSLLHNNQPPLTTLTWMLFVYGAAVLTPLAGLLAAADLLRRWRRNRDAAALEATDDAGTLQGAQVQGAHVQAQPAEAVFDVEAAEPRQEQQPAPQASDPQEPAEPTPAAKSPAAKSPAANAPTPKKPATKKTATKKAGTKNAA
jgi:hypothetical protein